jgi:co-chaperonin GroES (HSP10)
VTVNATVRGILPFYGRITVAPSPVDEEQRESGLIVPIRHEEIRKDSDRGIVLAVDVAYYEATGEWGEYVSKLIPGTVVHFRRGVQIGDFVIIDLDDILAYESE